MLAGLLHVSGQTVAAIWKTLSKKDNEDSFEEAAAKLTTHFNPKKNKIYERHIFRSLKQLSDESTLTFATRLRTASRYCEFNCVDEEILQTILQNGSSDWLTQRVMQDQDQPTLESLLKTASAKELSTMQVNEMRAKPEFVNNISNSLYGNRANMANRDGPCGYCGRDKTHTSCPAKDKNCNACGKKGHFESVCRSKSHKNKNNNSQPRPRDRARRKVNYIANARGVDDEITEYNCFSINYPKPSEKLPKTRIQFLGHSTNFVIDSGSELNIIDIDEYNRIKCKPELHRPLSNVYRFDSNTPINFIGSFKTTLDGCKGSAEAKIQVLERPSASPNILGYESALALGLIKIINNIEQQPQPKSSMKERYPELFSGEIGCLKNFQLKLYEDISVKPTKMFHYRIPYHLQKQVSEHLDKNEKRGLIEKATGPTSWISASHVVPKKDGRIRLVIDARPVNKAIIRHRYITPTLDDIATKLNGSTVFSKIDLQEAYRQIKLAPESRHLTVFSTHQGLYRDTRLSMGMNAAAENFQWIVADQIKDLKGCINVSDDIIVHGRTYKEQDENLHKLLERLQKIGFTARLDKCEFGKSDIDFFGVNFSAKGMSPSESRVEAFQKAKAPNTFSELRSLLASANYSSRFINNFAGIVAPLRELLKESSPFKWLPEHDKALKCLKSEFTTHKLAYFNTRWNTEVICDASPVGLGAILTQVNPEDENDKVIIQFNSKSLSPLEKKYSQVEREALALVFAVEKFHQYLYGKRFKLYTDAKAIVFIYGNLNHKSPARIERWGLRLLPYNFEIVHTPGESNPADYLSRHPVEPAKDACNDADLYVNFIVDSTIPRAITRAQIGKATREDPEMQTLTRAITDSNHNLVKKSESLKEYNSIFNELSVSSDGIILRKHQIVVPKQLRSHMVDIAHEGHLGIVKTKGLMRLKVWFPRLDHMVETKIGGCLACQACTTTNNKMIIPLMSEPVPNQVWKSISGDFFGPLPSGHYLLSIVCKTSGYPIVEVLSSTSAQSVIPVCDRIFSEFGIPEIFGSDNGPPFQSREFSNYCAYMGIKHQRSTPYWPRGNAKCERLMKSLGKVVRTAQIEKKHWRQCLNQFLRNGSTGTSPNQLMFGRNISSRLPKSN